jgi:purine-nucleoside/S-methyl-5'-thioadenosine phosphorylase / adenosine deaminase
MGGAMIEPPVFNEQRVRGFFTTKRIGDDADEVLRYCAVPASRFYMPVQKHTDKIIVVGHDAEPVVGDAVVTHRSGIAIGVRVADCVPVLVFERKAGLVAAVHAGWRGTASGILRKTIDTMIERFNAEPTEMLLAIGPSIKGCCYCVDYDVMHAVAAATGKGNYHIEKEGKYFLDLSSANMLQAVSAGVPESQIWTSDDCTSCRPDRYYSYRYAKGTTGRQGGFIILR